jgi:phosphate starvation-inducible protein PhoH
MPTCTATARCLCALQLAKRVNSGASIDISHLQQLAARRRWSFGIAAAGAASLAVACAMGASSIQDIKKAINKRAAAEAGILQLTYRKCV